MGKRGWRSWRGKSTFLLSARLLVGIRREMGGEALFVSAAVLSSARIAAFSAAAFRLHLLQPRSADLGVG